MRITYDANKRKLTLEQRGLDFDRAKAVFAGLHLTQPDRRENYGEPRFITAGWLDGRLVILVWTPRGRARRIISMSKANAREVKAIRSAFESV